MWAKSFALVLGKSTLPRKKYLCSRNKDKYVRLTKQRIVAHYILSTYQCILSSINHVASGIYNSHSNKP